MVRTAPELQLLGFAILIGIVQLAWAAVAARRQQNLAWARGPRDEPMPISGTAARLDRAFRNFMETFPLFAAAVVAADLLGKLGPLTLWGCGLYVAARALYVPLYATGVPTVRTLVWLVSLVGLLMVVVAIFL
ncbi:hypothetical protein DJ021_16640 [Phenylobacterium hankyongense]|uniref:MAPEG family protein n=1 Tax=Phenylobacterium hankyongense TaxID=1813876 RepID=A0A328B1I6_9CAUL|nr:MAPEG family protein [Phenylobacterium hankyongense]RAK61312.1 hypothetical protein DJ021_16640 [Phenylobacterium hankyongense]